MGARKKLPVDAKVRPVSKKARRPSLKQQKAVAEYVASLVSVLRLDDWTVDVDFSAPAEEALADTRSMPNQKYATIRLGEGFWTMSSRMQSQTLLHEVLHCHSFALVNTTETTLGVLASGKALRVATGVLNDQAEQLTDALADVLVDLVPPLELP